MFFCFFTPTVPPVSPMSPGVVWTAPEEASLIQFLVEHQSECGDGGNFKAATFQWAAAHIAPLLTRGPAKTVKSIQNKWSGVSSMYFFLSSKTDSFGSAPKDLSNYPRHPEHLWLDLGRGNRC